MTKAELFQCFRRGWRIGAMGRPHDPRFTDHDDIEVRRAYERGRAAGFSSSVSDFYMECERIDYDPRVSGAAVECGGLRAMKTSKEQRDELRTAGSHGRDPRYVAHVNSKLLQELLDDIDDLSCDLGCVRAERDAWKSRTRDYVREYMTNNPDLRMRELSDQNGVLEAERDLARTKLLRADERGVEFVSIANTMRDALEWIGSVDCKLWPDHGVRGRFDVCVRKARETLSKWPVDNRGPLEHIAEMDTHLARKRPNASMDAAAFWAWFQKSSMSETRDSQCVEKLSRVFVDREDALVARMVAWLRENDGPGHNAWMYTAANAIDRWWWGR